MGDRHRESGVVWTEMKVRRNTVRGGSESLVGSFTSFGVHPQPITKALVVAGRGSDGTDDR